MADLPNGLYVKRVAFIKGVRFSGHRATWRYQFRVGFVSTACLRAPRTFARATLEAGRGLVVTFRRFLIDGGLVGRTVVLLHLT